MFPHFPELWAFAHAGSLASSSCPFVLTKARRLSAWGLPSPPPTPDRSGTVSCPPVSSPQGIRNRETRAFSTAQRPGCWAAGRKLSRPAPLIQALPITITGQLGCTRQLLTPFPRPVAPVLYSQGHRTRRACGLGWETQSGARAHPAEERAVGTSKLEGKATGWAPEAGGCCSPTLGQWAPPQTCG